MLQFVEGKLTRLTHDVLTLRMERIPMAMWKHVVGVSPSGYESCGGNLGLFYVTERLWCRKLRMQILRSYYHHDFFYPILYFDVIVYNVFKMYCK